ncbi:MAG TPA: hypothetical protein VI583_04500 [Cyclobacteriaceae bacterium]|nr:hypothetical protein [Cyclobacteriaceae bacterium]
MTGRYKSIFIAATFFLFATEACYYNVKPHGYEAPPDSVSFSNDLVPIFETGCAISGCHNAGGIPPDLSAENAYNSLTLFGYVEFDSAMADQSLIYQKISTGSMAKYASDENRAWLLKWIQQGAKNN